MNFANKKNIQKWHFFLFADAFLVLKNNPQIDKSFFTGNSSDRVWRKTLNQKTQRSLKNAKNEGIYRFLPRFDASAV